MSPGGGLRGRPDAGVHERPAADLHVLQGFTFARRPIELGGGQGLQGQRRDRSGGHLRLQRQPADRHRARQPRRARSTSTTRSAGCPRRATSRGWPTTAWATSSRCIKDFSKTGDDDQFVRYINRWDLRKAEPAAAVSPPEQADHLLDRKDGALSSTASRSARASWSGTRPSRRPASPTPSRSASSPTTPLGTPKTSTTTRSAGSPPAPASPWAPAA